jgi:hypothetical protein
MNFYYTVVETLDGVKQEPVILSDIELKNKIEELTSNNESTQHTIITEKAGWYRINYGQRKSYIRYKRNK